MTMASGACEQPGVDELESGRFERSRCERRLFGAIQYYKRSFYKDRLGTNMGKVEGKGRFVQATRMASRCRTLILRTRETIRLECGARGRQCCTYAKTIFKAMYTLMMIILPRQARGKHGTRETLKNRLPFSHLRIRNVTLKNPSVTAGPQSNWGSCMGTYAFTSLTLDGFRCAPTRFCVFLHLAREPALTNFKSLLFFKLVATMKLMSRM